MTAPRRITIGVDLGKLRDYTAIAVIERFSTRAGRDPVMFHDVYQWTNTLRSAHRIRLGTSYPAVVERIRAVVLAAHQQAPVTLVVDATGVGQPVVDALRAAALPCELLPVTITAGEHSSRSRSGYNVPKRELIVGLQMLFARNELKIPADLPLRPKIIAELTAMTRRLKADSNTHDDLALSLALAAWPLRPRPSIGHQPYPVF